MTGSAASGTGTWAPAWGPEEHQGRCPLEPTWEPACSVWVQKPAWYGRDMEVYILGAGVGTGRRTRVMPWALAQKLVLRAAVLSAVRVCEPVVGLNEAFRLGSRLTGQVGHECGWMSLEKVGDSLARRPLDWRWRFRDPPCLTCPQAAEQRRVSHRTPLDLQLLAHSPTCHPRYPLCPPFWS